MTELKTVTQPVAENAASISHKPQHDFARDKNQGSSERSDEPTKSAAIELARRYVEAYGDKSADAFRTWVEEDPMKVAHTFAQERLDTSPSAYVYSSQDFMNAALEKALELHPGKNRSIFKPTQQYTDRADGSKSAPRQI